MWNVSLTSSEQVATETRMTAQTEETYFRFRTIAVSFFIFPLFFLPSFTVKSGSVTGCSIKIYRPGEKTRERERREGKEKKMLSTALTLLFPFTLVSSSRGTVDEQVYRTTRRIMNRNAGIVFRSGSRLTVLNQSRAWNINVSVIFKFSQRRERRMMGSGYDRWQKQDRFY